MDAIRLGPESLQGAAPALGLWRFRMVGRERSLVIMMGDGAPYRSPFFRPNEA